MMDSTSGNRWDGEAIIRDFDRTPPGTVVFDVVYPGRLSRLLVLVKWLLVIPHLFVMYFLGICWSVVTFIAWFAILFTGHYPMGMWQFSMKVLRWSTNLSVYLMLMRDEYPPFSDRPYPIVLEMQYPGRQSRLLIFFRWLLIIPHVIALWFISIAIAFVWFLSFFAILITGRYPKGMFDFMTGALRWSVRSTAYSYFLTDVYPPFSMDPA